MAEKPVVIHTPRLRLGPIRAEDREAMTDILTHPETGKTYMVPEFSCREEAEKLFETFRRLSGEAGRFVYGIFRAETLVGFLNEVEAKDGMMELGYVTAPAHKNRGYATEALTAAMDALFAMGFSAVRTGAFEENLPSIRVMEKSGMTRLACTEEIAYRGQVHRCVFFEKRK